MEILELDAEQIKESATKIKFEVGLYSELIERVLNDKKRGLNTCYICGNSDVELYSLIDSEEEIYSKLFGCSKEEYEQREKQRIAEYNERIERQYNESVAMLPEWIEEGKKYVYPQRQESFANEVSEFVKSQEFKYLHGLYMPAILEAMKMLDDDASIKKVKKYISGADIGNDGHVILNYVLTQYSKRGVEYGKTVYRLNKANKAQLDALQKMNDSFKASTLA